MGFFRDFRKFAFKGNVVDLAVGVVIGGAFGKIVTALVADLVMPVLSLITPSGNWRQAGIVLRRAADEKDNVVLNLGDLFGSVVDFFIISLVLFVFISRVVRAAEQQLADPDETPAPRLCPYCRETVHLQATRCKACTSQLA